MNDSHLVLDNEVRRTHALLPINLPLARHPSPRGPLPLPSVPPVGNFEPQRGCACVKGIGSARAARYRCVASPRGTQNTQDLGKGRPPLGLGGCRLATS